MGLQGLRVHPRARPVIMVEGVASGPRRFGNLLIWSVLEPSMGSYVVASGFKYRLHRHMDP